MPQKHHHIVQITISDPKPPKHLVPQVPSPCLKSRLVYRPGGCPAILAPGSSPGDGSYILGNAGRPRGELLTRPYHPFIAPFAAALFSHLVPPAHTTEPNHHRSLPLSRTLAPR